MTAVEVQYPSSHNVRVHIPAHSSKQIKKWNFTIVRRKHRQWNFVILWFYIEEDSGGNSEETAMKRW